MTDSAYSFLPWLRAGIATKIGETPASGPRATIPVKLSLAGDAIDGTTTLEQSVERDVQVYGPGDIIGIDPRAISRTEPRPWITAFEPNYLAHIEFYEEHFPWSYSPAPQDSSMRVMPWLALIVLAAGKDPQRGTVPATGDEFAEGDQPGPLPSIIIADPATTLQPPDELGAWAHVHVNGALADSVTVQLDPNGQGPALDNLATVLASNADNACSRIICPRHLAPDTSYHAFLVPALESGRLAGLGIDPPENLAATQSSWGPGAAAAPRAGQMPYYFRWFFSTGDAGDFDHLVRLLTPRDASPTVARRDIDVHDSAGFGLPGIDDAKTGGILKLGGALQPDRPRDDWDNWDRQPVVTQFPHPFQTALAKLVNLADNYLTQAPAAAHAALAPLAPLTPQAPQALPAPVDPVITPPIYGRWPALSSRLLTGRDGSTLVPDPAHESWVQKLNLDPRYRVAANFGAQVFQARQEEFMTAAWEQIGDVLKANSKIRSAQLQREVGRTLHAKHIAQPPAPAGNGSPVQGRALTVTAPAHPRVIRDDQTDPGKQNAVGYQVATSRVRAAPLSQPMRRLTRPGSRLMRGLPFDNPQQRHLLLDRMDRDGVTAAAPKIRPDAVVTPAWVTVQVEALIGHTPPPGQPPPPPPDAPAPGNPVPGLPANDQFTLSLDTGAPARLPTGSGDSDDAKNFKAGLTDLYNGWFTSFAGGATVTPGNLGIQDTTLHTLDRLRSDKTVPRSVGGSVTVAPRLQPQAQALTEVMAYPVIDQPMYEPLRDASVEEFVPGLGLVPPNTITILLTEHAFIESYMAGLNHEMAREMLWREYPTDQRGTPFRQFWNTHMILSLPDESAEARRERLYDIKRIADWRTPAGGFTELGANGNRILGQSQDPADPLEQENLVLIIRGELLKKYPTAAVYANKAAWKKGPDSTTNLTGQPRHLVQPADPNNPADQEIRMPIYAAKVEPDLYLLGFSLTKDEALGFRTNKTPTGTTWTPVGDGAGWFFVIKERPGDPRFGAEIDTSGTPELWDDISWQDVDPDGQHGFIRVDAATAQVQLSTQAADDTNADQHREDLSLPAWSGNLSSADIAYILFRVPVLMAVHAQEMLPDGNPAQ